MCVYVCVCVCVLRAAQVPGSDAEELLQAGSGGEAEVGGGCVVWRSGETRCGMVEQCNMTSNYSLVYSSRVNVATCKYVCTMKKRVTLYHFK